MYYLEGELYTDLPEKTGQWLKVVPVAILSWSHLTFVKVCYIYIYIIIILILHLSVRL